MNINIYISADTIYMYRVLYSYCRFLDMDVYVDMTAL